MYAAWHGRTDLSTVTPVERSIAKSTCYAVMYGQGVTKLALSLNQTTEEARRIKPVLCGGGSGYLYTHDISLVESHPALN